MEQTVKCVMVIDGSLPLGLIANTAGVMGITLGRQLPELVGEDVRDNSGGAHLGIVETPVPVLKGDRESIRVLRDRIQAECPELVAVDFSDLAQSCRTYEEFIQKMAGAGETELHYLGIGICGPAKLVNRLTGSMPLLR